MADYVVLCFDELRVALPLAYVERVIRAVSLLPLPGAPPIVLGIINLQGRIVPVVDMHQRFGLPNKEITVSDQIVIVQTARRPVAVVADGVSGIVEFAEPAIVEAESILPGLEYVEGVLKLDDGMILIHNLDRFLSLDEGEALDRAMATATGQ